MKEKANIPSSEQQVIYFPEETEPQQGFTVFVTGHMPDRPNRPIPRFPNLGKKIPLIRVLVKT